MSQLEFKTIKIKNFKTFSGQQAFKMDRKPGLYYITGKNLLNPELGANGVGKSTIWDALTWVLWGKTGRDNKPAAAITPWGTKAGTEVSVDFMRNGHSIQITRTRNPNSLQVWVDEDGDVAGREIQQDEVPKILGMSEAMFRRTMVLGQFGSLFLDEKPEAQAQMFTEALNLDIWVQAREVASKAGNAAARKAISFQAQIDAQVKAQERLKVDMDDAEQRSALFEEDKAAKVRKIENGIITLIDDLKELTDAPVLAPKMPAFDKSASLQVRLADLRAKLAAETQKLNQAQKDLERDAERVDYFEGQIKQQKKLCEACGQPLSDKKFKEQLDAAKAVKLASESKEQELRYLVEELRERKDFLNKDIDQAILEEAASRKNYQAAQASYTTYLQSVLAVRAELNRQRTALKEAQAQANTAEQELERLRQRRASLRLEMGELKESLAQAQQDQADADYWVDAFREIRLGIIDSALLELEMAASRHASMLGLDNWGIKFDTEKETQGGKVNYTFNVMLYPPGQDDPVKWECYSGGESQRWQLAVAFALSEVLLSRAGLSPNLEVLDEPTRGLSSDGVSDLLDHLHDRALELGRAVYFVDHHSLDKGAFDGTLSVEKASKGSTFRWL